MYISNGNFDFIYNIDKYYSDFGNHGNVTLVLKSKLNDKKQYNLPRSYRLKTYFI